MANYAEKIIDIHGVSSAILIDNPGLDSPSPSLSGLARSGSIESLHSNSSICEPIWHCHIKGGG
ncbi:hypothetical protein YE0092 [Yersinia enterocolitica subsp. enterocolitica 8081]|uniref:Uncharacterized protein n=1 Tax=Yersinia enterocolitica serotype O:8 / biotype 1B (strain NCTC 13174 / 8081) TaxID=393305 RepID=A1JHZ6_YERE8|nr:hypothetical protein YE0092 [Yersinia enterocolitica subsp. enterocolitica 8081]